MENITSLTSAGWINVHFSLEANSSTLGLATSNESVLMTHDVINITKAPSNQMHLPVNISPSSTNQTSSVESMLVAVEIINKYIFPVSLVIGIVFNIMVVFLMRCETIKKSNYSVYITALAFSDTYNLLCYILVMYPNLVFQVDFRTLSDAACRLFRYLVKTFLFFSSWMVCVIALERVFVVVAPFKSKQYVSKKNAILITIGLLVVTLVGMNPFLWMSRLIQGKYCMVHPQYDHFDKYYGRWIDFSFSQYIPACIIIICNVILLTKLMNIRKKRAIMSNKTNKDKQKNFAVTAVTICCAYLAFAMPNSIFYVLFIQNEWYKNSTPNVQLIQALLNLIGTFNYSSNLILYILSSHHMRTTFVDMVCCCHRNGSKDEQKRTLKGFQHHTMNNRSELNPTGAISITNIYKY